MDRVREIINVTKAHKRGYYGEGIGIAVLDTGECVIIMSDL